MQIILALRVRFNPLLYFVYGYLWTSRNGGVIKRGNGCLSQTRLT